jgi:hypothetical protein
MSESKYEQLVEGEIYSVKVNRKKKSLYDACCDCSLVHGISIWSDEPTTIHIMLSRDNRRTAQLRRHTKDKTNDA